MSTKKSTPPQSSELADQILAGLRSDLIAFLDDQAEPTDAVEYEQKVAVMANEFARKVIVGQAGALPKSRNSKKKF